GHLEEAARWHRESLKWAANNPAAEPVDWCGLALVSFRLGRPDEARQDLDKAAEWIRAANASRPKEEAEFMPATMQLSDWLEYLILSREAEAALEGPAK